MFSRKSDENGPVEPIETVGQRIKRERLEQDMTQRALADAVVVGVPHISKIESSRESPSDELLMRIAEVLDIAVEELLLVARRVPDEMVESFASDPAQALAFFRAWSDRNEAG